MTPLIKEIEDEVKLSGTTPQDVITYWASVGDITAEQAAQAEAHFAKQSASDPLNVKPYETPAENTSANPFDVNKELEDRRAKDAKEAERIGKPIGQRDFWQWNSDISPVTNVLAHPLAAFSAGIDEVASALRPDYPNRTFSENYDLAMEKYQKKNPGNPRNIWDGVAMTGTEMLGESFVTAGIAPAVSILKNAKHLKDAGQAVKHLKDAKTLKDAAKHLKDVAKPFKDATNALLAYAAPQLSQTAKPLKDAADAVNKLPALYTNPYFRGAVENAVFAGIDPELSKADVAANVVAGAGATKALTNIPFFTGKETRKSLIDDGLTGLRQVIDAPKQGKHADRYNEALPWVLENLETRHWHGGGPGKTLQNLEKSADAAMDAAANLERKPDFSSDAPYPKIDELLAHRNQNPRTYDTKVGKKVADRKHDLYARIDDAFAQLVSPQGKTKPALETMSYAYDEATKLVRDPDPVLRRAGEAIIEYRDNALLYAFGEDGAEAIKDALFKKSVADSYKQRINLGEINAAKKDIHQVAKEHVFTPFIKAASLGEGPNALARAAYPIVKEDSRENFDWLKSFTQPF